MTQSKISAWCDALLELCWLSALILTPLFFNVHSDRVFEPDKLTLLRSLALLTAALLLIKFIDNQGWQHWRRLTWQDTASIWRMPFVAPILAISATYLISNFFSVTPSVSWAGSYQRLQGTYTTLSYIIIFFGLVYAIRNTQQIQRIATLAIVVSIPVALYAMLQRFGLDPLPWGGNVVRRVAGHMGNAIFIAAYLIMVIPLTLARIITAFTNILSDEELNIADIIRSSIYIFTLAIQFIALYMSGSRGPLLGLLIGLFAFIVIFLISLRNNAEDQSRYTTAEIIYSFLGALFSIGVLLFVSTLPDTVAPLTKMGLFLGSIGIVTLAIFVLVALRIGWKWLWLSWMLLSIWGAVWLGLFNFTDDLIDNGHAETPVLGNIVEMVDEWRGLPTVGRFGRILENQSTNALVRIYIWRGVVDMIQADEPITFPNGEPDPYFSLRRFIGYGPEAMYVAYNNFYRPELGTVEARNASPDRSHNETWDAFVITGLLGYLTWQWLYLSVFYHTFSWLGIIRQRRDTILLIGLWFGGGAILAYLFATIQEPAFIGVAFPFGSIIGLIIYLIYYAITTRPQANQRQLDPFQSEFMLILAIIAVIVAFYVEIHFGIAIAATRTYFFVYTGVLLALGHYFTDWRQSAVAEVAQPAVSEVTEVVEEVVPTTTKSSKKGRGSRRRRKSETAVRSTSSGIKVADWFSPIMIWSFLLGLVIATLAFNFTIYTPPPGTQIQTLADVPTAGEIFQQAFFVNPAQDFSESPFIYLMVMMSWALGSLIILSEMAKNKEWKFAINEGGSTVIPAQSIGIIYIVVGIVLAGLFFVGYFELLSEPISPTQRVGFLTLSPLGAIAAFFAGTSLLFGRENRFAIATGVAMGGVAIALPIMIAGGLGTWVGSIILGGSISILYLLWDKSMSDMVRPTLILTLVSLSMGLLFAYLHASRIASNFITPAGVTNATSETMRRVAEAIQFADLLSLFYVFLFFFIMVASIFVSLQYFTSKSSIGHNYGIIALFVLIPVAFWLVNTTNLNIIRADMVYKRGKPWDQQAGSAMNNPEAQDVARQLWDNTIAIYEHALELTPREDFYFLWLGRAYLEESSLLQGPERDQILETARQSLITAQTINPLNTDHTANLARLHTRWAGLESGEKQEELLQTADNYYQAATKLSPQNSVIRNEHARMIYSYRQDCEQTIALYDASILADPTYGITRFELAEIMGICLTQAADAAEREQYTERIFSEIEMGIDIARSQQGFAQRWLRAAQAYQQSGEFDFAARAYEQAMQYPDNQSPLWQMQYLLATSYADAGDIDQAREQATESLANAPADLAPQIEQFINDLGN